ncbi:hypothetical protein CEXT_372921 [Caerostris extrusa]|uniref:Uncharacterized protein n=1 Tax=Caerostris extrusa TaxID=172846 RepID=A0AAV4UBZ5_CAEEX|nr:hypothetical protein CEXT_372921 [Caerostris extrusa]
MIKGPKRRRKENCLSGRVSKTIFFFFLEGTAQEFLFHTRGGRWEGQSVRTALGRKRRRPLDLNGEKKKQVGGGRIEKSWRETP